MVQNILGNGIDIPLLGLREASREVDSEYHEMFTDESYKIAQCFLLSTSQVKSFSTTLVEYCTLNFMHLMYLPVLQNRTIKVYLSTICFQIHIRTT